MAGSLCRSSGPPPSVFWLQQPGRTEGGVILPYKYSGCLVFILQFQWITEVGVLWVVNCFSLRGPSPTDMFPLALLVHSDIYDMLYRIICCESPSLPSCFIGEMWVPFKQLLCGTGSRGDAFPMGAVLAFSGQLSVTYVTYLLSCNPLLR